MSVLKSAAKSRLYYITVLSTLLSGTSAFAQAASPPPEDIVITGSRVIRNGNNSPSPTTIASSQELLTVQPGQLNDALQILPVFAGSRGSANNPSSTGSTTGGNGAANVLNLRNLGVRRTLTLLDGERIPPTLFNGNVDVDLIPQMLVQRVDVVTGGVSAVYGSDAISGVVNYVTDKRFNGLKLQANAGISDRNDGEKTDAGIAFGKTFAEGRGHVEGSYEYRNEKGVLHRSDREWIRQAGITGQGTVSNPFVLIADTRQNDYAFGGLITTGVLTGQVFKSNGVLSPFVHGQSTGVSTIEIGGDGAYYDASLLSPMRSDQFFGRFDFDLTHNFKFYAEVLGDVKTNHSYADYLRINNVFIRSTNAYLAPQYQQALAAAGQTTFRLRELLSNAPRLDLISNTEQWVGKTGLSGELGDYNWGVDLIYGRTKLHTVLGHNTNYMKLAASLDAVTNSAGQVVCNVTVTNPGVANDCVPLNPFGPTAGSAAAYAYFQTDTDWDGLTETPSIVAHVDGAPFALPAGPVNMALSGEWRKTSFSSETTSDGSTPYSCTGIALNCTTAPRLYELTLAGFPKASESVWEVAYEADAPIFDVGGKSLNVNGAARYTSYEQSGDYITWKAGVDLRLSDALRFRGTRSRDIRAPNVFDLFAPPNPTLVTGTDLLTGLPYSLLTAGGGGNLDLKAEKGSTLTAGVVWKPLSNFSASLDYFHITITDALSNISGRDTASQNECYASGGTSPYCALQGRANGDVAAAIAAFRANPASVVGNPAYAATRWSSLNLNVAEQETSGWDLEVNYSTRLFDRPASVRLMTAYQPHVYTRQPGIDTVDNGGVGWGPDGTAAGPSTSVTALARYQVTDAFTIDVMQRWRDKLKISGVPSDLFAPGEGAVDSWTTTNLNLTYEKKGAAGSPAVFLNIQNLFDKHPPIGAYTANGTRAGARDGFAVGDNPMGRYYTLGVRLNY